MAFGEKKDDKRTSDYKAFCEKFKDYPKRDRLNYHEAQRKWNEYQKIYNQVKDEGVEYPATIALHRWFVKEGAITEDGATIYKNLRKVISYSGKDDEAYIFDEKPLLQVEEDFRQITSMFSPKKSSTELLSKIDAIGN